MNNLLKILLLVAMIWGLASCNKGDEVLKGDPDTEMPGDSTKVPEEPQTPVNPYNSQVETTKPTAQNVNVNVNSNIGGYRASIPSLYDKTDKKYPLLIFIHGIGELGNGTTDLMKVAYFGTSGLVTNKTFPANFKVNGENFSFIVISPQFKAWPSADDMNALLSHLQKKYRIDPKRVYVSGASMGGGVTWQFAGKFANKLAAIVPICGAATLSEAEAKLIANNKVAVWAFHNKDDGTVGVSNTTTSISRIKKYNPTVSVAETLWETGGHDAWTKATSLAYKESNKNIYEWMLSHKRP